MKKGTVIPNKLYFRIGEVADLLSVKPYVLRYWETEFPDIKPSKSKSGQRLYKRKDVEVLVSIKELLYDERFTINGARKRLKELFKEHRGQEAQPQMHFELPAKVAPTVAPAATPHPQTSASVFMEERAKPPQADFSRVFTKIKKDLESILAALKT